MTLRKRMTLRLPPLHWNEIPTGAFIEELVSGKKRRYSLEFNPTNFRYTLFVDGRAVASVPNLERGKEVARKFRYRAWR